MDCEFCNKKATHVIVSHGMGHGQWDKLPTLPICGTCHEVAKYMVHLINEENDFIMFQDIREDDNETA
jgi:hypothetical protein